MESGTYSRRRYELPQPGTYSGAEEIPHTHLIIKGVHAVFLSAFQRLMIEPASRPTKIAPSSAGIECRRSRRIYIVPCLIYLEKNVTSRSNAALHMNAQKAAIVIGRAEWPRCSFTLSKAGMPVISLHTPPPPFHPPPFPITICVGFNSYRAMKLGLVGCAILCAILTTLRQTARSRNHWPRSRAQIFECPAEL